MFDNPIAQSYVNDMSEAERQLLPLVIMLLTGAMVWLVVQWIRNAAPRPEPWDARWKKTLEEEDPPPVCEHCSAPYSQTDWFCPGCGASVGAYNNYSPYLVLFCLGEGLRRGTSGAVPVNWLSVGGYMLLSIALFFSLPPVFRIVLVPVYWLMLCVNLAQHARQASPGSAASS